jgi:hypothetical protein
MPYTPPVAGSADWDVALNLALADISKVADVGTQGGAAAISSAQTTTSTSYVDLTTAGPIIVVTLTELRTVLIFPHAELLNTATSDDVYMSFTVSGATAFAASDTRCLRQNGTGTASAFCACIPINLNAGSNTITAKYRVDAGTGQFTNRSISAVVT